MRYALLGDVHGNLEGLTAVLAVLAAEQPDAWLCTGDLVGYGADPNACCDVLRDLGATCLFGNHDQACLGLVDLAWFNPYARHAAAWTASQLAPHHREWLATLPPTRQIGDFLVVHSSLPDPWRWTYVTTPDLAGDTLAACDSQVVFIGHTHLAEAYRWTAGQPISRAALKAGGTVTIEPGCRYVINPGSCGQPRDLNPAVSCAIYDTAARQVTVLRVAYDAELAAAKILQAGLPEFLGRRLLMGR